MANIDSFAKRFSLLTEEERNQLLDIVKLDKIKSEFENHKNSLSEKGYHLSSHCTSYEQSHFSKNVLNDEPMLHVKLVRNDLGEWRCEISHMIGLIKVTSGEFCYPHDGFSRIFEKQVLNVATAAEHLQPERLR